MGRALLLTGRPGVGKTTIVKAVANGLGEGADGFYTEEIRGDDGRRVGFRLKTLRGESAVMAHRDLAEPGRPRVSQYGVDISAIEHVGVPALRRAASSGQLIVVDEIGKMELFSDLFREAVMEAVENEAPLLGTVMWGHHPWVDKLKARQEVEVWEVTTKNRDGLPDLIREWLRVDADTD